MKRPCTIAQLHNAHCTPTVSLLDPIVERGEIHARRDARLLGELLGRVLKTLCRRNSTVVDRYEPAWSQSTQHIEGIMWVGGV